MNNPKVTVIIPVYNGEKFVRQAIQSIIDQTFKDFEIMVIDDCSTDNSAEVIKTFTDPRVKYMQNEKNCGSTRSRNNGLNESTGEYIAILDCDDLSLPTRLEEEVEFLDAHPDFGVVGSWTKIITEDGKENGFAWKNDLASEYIPAMLLFKNYLTHSSTMIRRKVMPTYYYDTDPVTADRVEDYTLWIEIIKKWKVCNLQRFLIKHRQHKTSLTASTPKANSQKAVDVVYELQLARLNIIPTSEELEVHKIRNNREGKHISDFIQKKTQWLEKLLNANNKINYYDEPYFSYVVGMKWFESCNMSTNLGFSIWRTYWSSPLSKYSHTSMKQKVKFLIKCLLKK